MPTPPELLAGTTDAEGRVTLGNLPQTNLAFLVTFWGYGRTLSYVQAPPAGEQQIKLNLAATVSGTVRDEMGKGIPKASVWFYTDWMHDFFYAETDEEGHYTADNLIGKGASQFANGGAPEDTRSRSEATATPPRRARFRSILARWSRSLT